MVKACVELGHGLDPGGYLTPKRKWRRSFDRQRHPLRQGRLVLLRSPLALLRCFFGVWSLRSESWTWVETKSRLLVHVGGPRGNNSQNNQDGLCVILWKHGCRVLRNRTRIHLCTTFGCDRNRTISSDCNRDVRNHVHNLSRNNPNICLQKNKPSI